MPSTDSNRYSLPVSVAGPVDVLPRRLLRVAFPMPSPLLRALGPGEQTDGGCWSAWLAEWGWAWAVTPESCAPALPLVRLWLDRGAWPKDFDGRALALAVALRLRVDGEPLSLDPVKITTDLERVWRTTSSLTREALGEILALALLRADSGIFNFASAAPSWGNDVGQVIAERRNLGFEREPAPCWLKSGYGLLGETFSMVRAMGTSLSECQDIWDSFAGAHEAPLAFEMAFWWEAAYCCTERHAYDVAEQAQDKVEAIAQTLEKLTGLVDPMWRHQQGRLHYYAGNHEAALAEYLREYKTHGEDLNVSAMLTREIANVLSDLGCLDAAKHFAERSIATARTQGQQTELYKSLGRLAEVEIKRGDFDHAEALLMASFAIQNKLGENRSPAQTLAYLGHVAVLKGDLDRAADWYDQAAERDEDRASLPYITMGRFAQAAAAGNTIALDQLWNAHRERIATWAAHQTHVLPAAVCVLTAASHLKVVQERLPAMVRTLLENRYAIEAAYALPDLPVECRQGLATAVISMLNRWQKALSALPPLIREMAGPINGPSKIIEAIQRADLCDSATLAANGYPMTLAARHPRTM